MNNVIRFIRTNNKNCVHYAVQNVGTSKYGN